jgi:hypothetical protein
MIRQVLISTIGLLTTVLMFNICFAVENEGPTYELKNEKIHLVLGQRGLVSIENLDLRKKHVFISDEFSVSINDQMIKSDELSASDIRANDNIITYTYRSDSYIIDVEYQLKSDWQFVSKQLSVTSSRQDEMTINEIEVFNTQISEDPVSEYVPKTKRPELGPKEYGTFLRFEDATGMMFLVQNPFLDYVREEKSISITYAPDMEWKSEYGSFYSDRGCIGLYKLTGQRLSAKLIPEWTWTGGVIPITDEEQDWAEVDAFTKCVKAFILKSPTKSLKMNAAWCENDYQIDIATPEGRDEYKRIIDRSAELGLDYILFAPTNSLLGDRKETADDWSWENLLWLGLGIKIRKGEWDPKTDPIPETVQEMLDYAKSKNIKLVAYMYPVMPFAGNPEWIVEGTKYHRKKRNASLGVRSFQDYLIENLSTFYERTGLGGYAYDYTFLWYDNTSFYAQWWGWRRIKETLRRKHPDIVIDGRQLDMLYGPWIWLSGSYPHPTAADEQPESFNPFPDLHFDRASANRQRFTAYRYRVNDYCPPELMPGFITHQTSRKEGDTPKKNSQDRKKGQVRLRLDSFRTRDWDYLGWKYSLISSIGTAGFNHVVSMIPARDLEEFEHFSDADKKFFRDWLNWTDKKSAYLSNTRPIIGQPAIGRIDGTSAIIEDNGFIFLFNPNARKMTAEFNLDQSIGLFDGDDFKINEIYPQDGKLIGKPDKGLWEYGDFVSITMDGGSAMVLEITPQSTPTDVPLLFNVKGELEQNANELKIKNVSAEIGSEQEIFVLMPGIDRIEKVTVHDRSIPFIKKDNLISFTLNFSGTYFPQMHQIGKYDPDFSGGIFQESFKIPGRIFSQLNSRKKEWPIPWTKEDYKTPWLAPERLLLFVQIAEVREEMDLQLKLNNKSVKLTPAYTSIRRHPRCFVGYYADISHLGPEEQYAVELILPDLKPGQFQGLFFENIEPEYTSEIQ